MSGRALARVTVAGPLREALVPLAPAAPISAGLYFVRVRGPSGEAVARVSVLR